MIVDYDPGSLTLVLSFVEGRRLADAGSGSQQNLFDAGSALRALHDHPATDDARAGLGAEWRLGGPAADERWEVPPGVAESIQHDLAVLRALPSAPVTFTHGDYQPRNWLLTAAGELVVLDFEHAMLGPRYRDFARLEYYFFPAADPALRTAFYSGYGRLPSASEIDALKLRRRYHAASVISWARRHAAPDYEQIGWKLLTSEPSSLVADDSIAGLKSYGDEGYPSPDDLTA